MEEYLFVIEEGKSLIFYIVKKKRELFEIIYISVIVNVIIYFFKDGIF